MKQNELKITGEGLCLKDGRKHPKYKSVVLREHHGKHGNEQSIICFSKAIVSKTALNIEWPNILIFVACLILKRYLCQKKLLACNLFDINTRNQSLTFIHV